MSESQEDLQALEEFKAGFSGETNEPSHEESAEVENVPEVVEPEYVQLTKEQFDNMQNRLGEIDHLKTAHAKTSGSIGTLNQVIEQLRSSTKQGAAVELSDDVVDGLKEEFGNELSGAVLAALKKAAPALRGTGTAQSYDPAQMEAQMDAKYSAKRLAEAQQELTEEHPDWTTVRDTKEFKDWRASLNANEQTRIDTTNSVSYLSKKLTEFKDSLKKQPPKVSKPNMRQAIVQAAVQPKGNGGREAPKTDVSDFHKGFYKK